MAEPVDRLSDPNICRCCLSDDGVWDLTKGYYGSTGPVKEILSDVLQECFGISLLYLNDEGVSHLICESCTTLLRQANHFRNLVQATELRFREYFTKKIGTQDVKNNTLFIKVEPLEVGDCSVQNSLDLSSGQRESKSPCREVKVKKSTKQKRAKVIKSENEQSVLKRQMRIHNTLLNRSIRHNTALILKNSTLVPFRNKQLTNYKYTCLYCESNFTKIQELRQHIDANHDQITENEIVDILKSPIFKLTKAEVSMIHCKICKQDLENLDNLIQHFTEVHKKTYNAVDFKPSHGILGFILESDVPTCYECRKEYPFLNALVAHMMGEHYTNFNCEKCDKKFLYKPNLDQHIQIVHGDSTYKCNLCDESFCKASTKIGHMLRVHGIGKLKCAECNETFTDHLKRTKHLIEAHNHKQTFFKCEICQKEFMTSSRLSDHIKTHGDNKVHECNICGKKVTEKTTLVTHMRTHTGERPYACQFCEKMFKSRSTLTVHERGHLNDKRYVCELCDAAFIQINSLRKHYMSRHPDCGIDLKSIRVKKVV